MMDVSFTLGGTPHAYVRTQEIAPHSVGLTDRDGRDIQTDPTTVIHAKTQHANIAVHVAADTAAATLEFADALRAAALKYLPREVEVPA